MHRLVTSLCLFACILAIVKTAKIDSADSWITAAGNGQITLATVMGHTRVGNPYRCRIYVLLYNAINSSPFDALKTNETLVVFTFSDRTKEKVYDVSLATHPLSRYTSRRVYSVLVESQDGLAFDRLQYLTFTADALFHRVTVTLPTFSRKPQIALENNGRNFCEYLRY